MTARLKRHPWAVLIFMAGLAVAGLEWLWKLPFLGGMVPGLYWLFVVVDANLLPMLVLTGVAAVLLLLLSIVQSIRHRTNYPQLLVVAVALFTACFLLFTTLVVVFAQHTVHMDSQRVRQHVYYLAAYPLFDINYRLYECDFTGMVCESVYFSGDLIGSEAWPGTLTYTEATNELVVTTGESTELFTYNPP